MTADSLNSFKILSWNINGVRNKFQDEEVLTFLKKFDIVLLNETHFNERIKCPEGFVFEGRSEKIHSKSPRGGVAVYRNTQCSLNIGMIIAPLTNIKFK